MFLYREPSSVRRKLAEMTFGFLEESFQHREWLASYLQPLDTTSASELQQAVAQFGFSSRVWIKAARNKGGDVLTFTTKHLASNLVAVV